MVPFLAHAQEELPPEEVVEEPISEVIDPPTCPEGEEFISELDMCVPIEPETPIEEEPVIEEEQQEETPEEEKLQCVLVSDTLTFEGEDAAVLVSELSGNWTALISGASWIWGEDPTANQEVTTSETFTRTFELEALPSGATLEIAADDGYVVKVNGNEIGADTGLESVNFTQEGKDFYVIPAEAFLVGTNELTVEMTNIAWEEGGENPGGLLFRLVIDGVECAASDDSTPGDPGNGGGSYTKKIKKGGGEVLGASTDACVPLIDTYMNITSDNDNADVMDLQGFLNGHMNAGLEVSGIFDVKTEAAVHAFQKLYWQDVLQPWFAFPESGIQDADDSTGYVYKTTKWKINNIVCPGSEALPTLP